MDVFTHFVLPYLVVYVLSQHRRASLAAGIGGIAPDLDSVTTLVAFWDPLYFLGHRGFSHSFLGAPVYALTLVLLLRAPFWRRVLPIAEHVRLSAPLAIVAAAFGYTHLSLDWLTMWGVPLLYPWSTQRFTTGWFFYSVTPMIPFSAWLAWRIARGTDTARIRRVGLALLVSILLVAGTIRAATFPRDGAYDVVQPAADEWSWNALAHDEKGWHATFYSWGRARGEAFYLEPAIDDPGAQAALSLARAHVEHRAFELYSAGPTIARVEPRDQGGWNVTFLDLMQRTQADRTPWFPLAEEAGTLRFAVYPDGRVEEVD